MVTRLSPLECEQLRITGLRFDGVDRSAESRLREEPREVAEPGYDPDDDDDDWWDDGHLAAHGLSSQTVTLADGTALDVWLHHADSGTAFAHGATEIVAECCQSQWMVPGLEEPSPLAEALQAALDRATRRSAAKPAMKPATKSKKTVATKSKKTVATKSKKTVSEKRAARKGS